MLSKQQKEELAKHYVGKEMYDPAKDPAQEPPPFKPQEIRGEEIGACEGGEIKGYDDGGIVSDDSSRLIGNSAQNLNEQVRMAQPVQPNTLTTDGRDQYGDMLKSPDAYAFMKANTEDPYGKSDFGTTPMPPPNSQPVSTPPPGFESKAFAAEAPMPMASRTAPKPPQMPRAAPSAIGGASTSVSSGNPGKLQPDQYQELIDTLSARPTFGQRVPGALAALGNGLVMTAGKGNPGFEQDISENQQKQRENLINALKAKYESQFRGQELGQAQQRLGLEAATGKETARHNKSMEGIDLENAANAKRLQALEGAGRLSQNGGIFGYKNTPQTQAAVDQMLKDAGIQGQPATGPQRVTSQAQYDALPKGSHYIDDTGKPKVKG